MKAPVFKKLLLYLFLLGIFIFVFSCSKTIFKIPVIHLPSGLKEYILFNPGSYWIYQDSISEKEDSVYVYNLILDSSLINSSGNSYYIDDSSHIFVSAQVDYKSRDQVFSQNILCNTAGTAYNPIQPAYPNVINVNSSSGSTIMFYPFNPSYLEVDNDYGPPADTLRLRLVSNYSINGLIFSNVLRFERTKNPSEDLSHSIRYFAPGVGLIQYQLVDSNKNYKLIRYHLN